MSKRNSLEAKREARQRLRVERERQAKRDKIRRQAVVGTSAVVVLGIAGAIGVAVANMGGGGDSTDWGAVSSQLEDGESGGETSYPSEPPSGAAGEDGLTIRLGDEDAPHTLTLFEDPRCPACASFEQAIAPAIQEGVDEGTFNVEYVFGSFLDERLGGSGSRNALSALGAALDVSPEAFKEYHELLYSSEFHPSEATDAYAGDERLIEIAQEVPDLEGNKQFEEAVNDSTFAAWALEMNGKFNSDEDVTGTPTLKFDGEVMQTPQTPDQFNAAIESAIEGGGGPADENAGEGSEEESGDGGSGAEQEEDQN